MNKIIAIFIIAVLAVGLVSVASASSGLKVIIKMKYSDYIREHGIGKAYFRYCDSDSNCKSKDLSKKFPKSVELSFGKGVVSVGEGFRVVLNSYVCDDATQVNGINHPTNSPERVTIRFPC